MARDRKTARMQEQIKVLLSQGLSIRKVALALGISRQTVRKFGMDRPAEGSASGTADRMRRNTHSAIPRKDSGAITHGLWQLTSVANGVSSAIAARFGQLPRRVFPAISTLQPFQIDDWVRSVYLDRLPLEAGIRFRSTWSKLDWIDIIGLDALAQLADDGRLDLLEILEGRVSTSTRKRRNLSKAG
ncbi:MAG: helix-turn-helix domain-containing protein [Polyangiaceae bacterium]